MLSLADFFSQLLRLLCLLNHPLDEKMLVLAVVLNRFGNKGKCLALYKGSPYFAVSITW